MAAFTSNCWNEKGRTKGVEVSWNETSLKFYCEDMENIISDFKKAKQAINEGSTYRKGELSEALKKRDKSGKVVISVNDGKTIVVALISRNGGTFAGYFLRKKSEISEFEELLLTMFKNCCLL